MKIGIFGGSFDPVHQEHVRLAEEAVKSLGLDKLFIVPACQPPHKRSKRLTSAAHRLKMCKNAFASLPQAVVSDYEIACGGTSYTYLTCRYFKEQFPDAELFWLVGTDMLRDFPTWKHPSKILETVKLAVCARAEKEGWLEVEKRRFFEKFGCDFAVVPYNGKAVSSTEIRILAGAGMRITDFVGEENAAYIEQNSLYKISGGKEALSLQSEKRRAHSLRVALCAAKKAPEIFLPEDKAVSAALLHDCAKNLEASSPLLKGFEPERTWGRVPSAVWHQFAGAFVAEHALGVKDEDVLNAIRFHTSGRAEMSELEKLIFLADMVEDERAYEGVERLRALFWAGRGEGGLNGCLKEALKETVVHLQSKGAEIYPLTLQAYEFYNQDEKENDYEKYNKQ